MFRTTLALALVFGLTAIALADLAPPPPGPGFKRVPFEHVMKLAAEIDDYQFYPFERMGINGKEQVGERLKLTTTTGVPVRSSSSPSVWTGVVAVPSKQMEELQSTDELAKLLKRENLDKLPAGIVIHVTFGTIDDITVLDPRSKVVNVVTVSRDEKAGVRFTEQVEPAPPGVRVPVVGEVIGQVSSGPAWFTLVAGAFLAAAIASIGLVVFRRKSRTP